VFYIGKEKVSYNYIFSLDKNSEEYSEVKIFFKNLIENWLNENQDKNIKDFLKIVKFRIAG
jgi:hypothetical protein